MINQLLQLKLQYGFNAGPTGSGKAQLFMDAKKINNQAQAL